MDNVISKTLKFVDKETRLTIADDMIITGIYNDIVVVDLPIIENYSILNDIYSSEIKLSSNDDIIFEYVSNEKEDSVPESTPDPELPLEEDSKDRDNIITDEDNIADDSNILDEDSKTDSNDNINNETPNTSSSIIIAPYVLTLIISLLIVLLSRRKTIN